MNIKEWTYQESYFFNEREFVNQKRMNTQERANIKEWLKQIIIILTSEQVDTNKQQRNEQQDRKLL